MLLHAEIQRPELTETLPAALQRYRIGPNFRFVDVNRPRCPVHSNAQDGPINIANQTGEVNYFPSSFTNQVRRFVSLTECIRCLGEAFQEGILHMCVGQGRPCKPC